MASNKKELTLSEKQHIYQILTNEFPLNTEIPMAKLNKALSDVGIDKSDYGYKKAKDFCLDLPEFLSLKEITMSGVPQVLVSIQKVDDWVTLVPENGDATSSRLFPEYSGRTIIPSDIEEELESVLSDFVFFPEKTLNILREKIPGDVDYWTLLNEDFSYARGNGLLRYSDGKVLFPLRYFRENGTPIIASIKRASQPNERFPWFLSYIDSYVKPKKIENKSSFAHEIEKFAHFPSWNDFLIDIADSAIPEPWHFDYDDPNEYNILDNYIRYTFYRLHLEDKICVNSSNSFAAFNTGLLGKVYYDDICVCFNSINQGSSWEYAGVCTHGSRGLGKILAREFYPPPQPPSYLKRIEDLLFDLETDLLIDYQHILIDDIHRLPIEVLEDEFHGSKEALGLISSIKEEGDAARKSSLFTDLSHIVEEDHKLFNRLRSRIDYTVELARRQIRWNYKYAIPSYYPRTNSISLLMPLGLRVEAEPDVALVIETLPNGNYQAQTILTLRQAYLNARILCRPGSEWLTLKNVSISEGKDPLSKNVILDETG